MPTPRPSSSTKPHAANRDDAHPVCIVAFNGCGLPRLRALVDSIHLSITTPTPQSPRWLEGLSPERGMSTPAEVAASLVHHRVALLAADPSDAITTNYRRLRIERRSTGCSLDDLLCARPPGAGPLTPECRLGLRACIDFMSAILRAQESYADFLLIHASEINVDPWAVAERVARFAGLDPTPEDLARAGTRAGPLGRAADTAPAHTTVLPLELSQGQRIFASGVIAEHLHPALGVYKSNSKRAARKAA
ncbi:MAG: hypothetical protein KF838_11970 [Phycisphaeraceae bacterium]|nr:MAG: hypothetical protein KF838_11970 [Phycisphaeraceae bacterium]